jgi:hypothetical protein
VYLSKALHNAMTAFNVRLIFRCRIRNYGIFRSAGVFISRVGGQFRRGFLDVLACNTPEWNGDVSN